MWVHQFIIDKNTSARDVCNFSSLKYWAKFCIWGTPKTICIKLHSGSRDPTPFEPVVHRLIVLKNSFRYNLH